MPGSAGQWNHIEAGPWYDHQRPALFAAALTAAKSALDPAGVLNPGVLLPARPC